MKKTMPLLAGLMLVALLSACAAPAIPIAEETPTLPPAPTAAAPVTLTVLAAASLTESFQEMAPAFEAAHPGVVLQFSFAGSQQLAQQLVNGAPADVFASANNKQMDVAVEGGRVQVEAPVSFAGNRLVVILPADNPAGIQTLADLARAGIKLDLAAREVPVGQYSLEFLDKAAADPSFGSDFATRVLANVVSYEENVKAVLTKVSLGEADAGIVYTTDAASVGAKLILLTIPDELNVIAEYPIAAIADSANPDMARTFIEWLLSAEGQAILQKHGFMSVK